MNIKLLVAKSLKHILHPPALRSCQIDKTSKVCPKSELTNVKLARYSIIGSNCFIVNAEIGPFCSIADRCCIGGAAHPVDRVSSSPVFHTGKNVLRRNFAHHPKLETPGTTIGHDVWIGMGCLIKAGVRIGNGAVIGMGSVVTHDVPAYEIWAGVPAKKLRDRFTPEIAAQLEQTEWWLLPEDRLKLAAGEFDNVERFLQHAEDLCE